MLGPARGISAIALALSLGAPSPSLAEWRRLDSPNFVVIGDLSARDLRDIAVKFEAFRATLSLVLTEQRHFDGRADRRHRVSPRQGVHAVQTEVPGQADRSGRPVRCASGHQLHRHRERRRALAAADRVSRVRPPGDFEHRPDGAGLAQRRSRRVLQHVRAQPEPSRSVAGARAGEPARAPERNDDAPAADVADRRSRFAALQRRQSPVHVLRAILGADASHPARETENAAAHRLSRESLAGRRADAGVATGVRIGGSGARASDIRSAAGVSGRRGTASPNSWRPSRRQRSRWRPRRFRRSSPSF